MRPLRPAAALALLAVLVLVAGCGSTAPGEVTGGGKPADAEETTSTNVAAGSADGTAPDGTGPEPAATPSAPAVVPELAEGASDLAQQLEQAERAVRDPATPATELAEAAHLQQVAYRHLARQDELVDPVLAALPQDLRRPAELQVAARREFMALNVNPPEDVPAWRIIAPAPAEDLLAYYQEAEDEFGVEWEYLAAINLVETGMGRIRGDSSAGAQGPMQFIPSTWERWGEGDIYDPHDAILSAGRYLAHNGGSADDGNIEGALFNYNNDVRYVRGVQDYAAVLRDDPQTYAGFHQWQIWYASAVGDLLFPEGYHLTEPQPAAVYAADHPERTAG